MKRFGTCKLLVGLTALMLSCGKRQASLQVLSYRPITLPSASAIVYHQNRLWVFGDDATCVMSYLTNHQVQDSICFWPGAIRRIPKTEKPDIESAYIRQEGEWSTMVGVGSMATANRWRMWEFDIATRGLSNISMQDSTATWPGVAERNVEGSCLVGGTVVMANRGNLSHPQNHLLFWVADQVPTVHRLKLPSGPQFAGVSDLCYVPEKDLLLLTASEEATASAYTDGAIGESYLGWITDFSKRMGEDAFTPNGWLPLSKMDAAFAKQKIEGVCVEKVEGGKLTLHLVSDNDGGESRIFKVLLER